MDDGGGPGYREKQRRGHAGRIFSQDYPGEALSLVLAFVAAGFLLFCLLQLVVFLPGTVTSTGVVTKIRRINRSNRTVVFRFKHSAGFEVTAEVSLTLDVNPYQVGQAVSVFYKQNDPVNARIADFWGLLFGLTTALGLTITALVTWMVLARRRRKAAEELPPPPA